MILTELGHNWNERVEKTGREWMVMLLGLCRETNERMIEDVKGFFWRECGVLDVGWPWSKDIIIT